MDDEIEEFWTLEFRNPSEIGFYSKLVSNGNNTTNGMVDIEETQNCLILKAKNPATNIVHTSTFHYDENSLGDHLIMKSGVHKNTTQRKSFSSSTWAVNTPQAQGFEFVGVSKKHFYNTANR